MNNALQKAVAAHQTGDFAEAEKLYRTVLAAQPDQADALALLGVICGMQGKHDEAVDLIEKAIARDPKSALFKFHYGSVLMNARRLPQAIVALRQAIVLQPTLAEAHYNLANALRAANEWAAAITAYKDAIKRRLQYPEAYNNLALCYVHEKQYDDALTAARKAVELLPNYGDGWITVCNVAEKLKDYTYAYEAGSRAIQLSPNNHFSWFGYAVALNRLDRHEEAIKAYERALTLKPERADIWDNLGQTYQSLNRLEEAEAAYRKTIEADGQVIAEEDGRDIAEEEYGNRHWHLALMELLRGKYIPGFARYRSRFKDVGGLRRPINFSRPLWKGEDISGKTLLITDEQGFGDTLMLARYLPMLKARGARVIFSVHPVLKPLFENWSGVDEVIVHGDVVKRYDYYASVFDLPHLFTTTLDTIPADIPYLPQLPPDEATRLPDLGNPKIGIVWGGNPLHLNDVRRSVPLNIFAELFSVTGVQFYSFNRDQKAGDAQILAQHPVIDLVPRLKNFADSTRLVGQMDLVISCDTATAHLAGGLGKETWVLLPFSPDWRWLTGRDDNPWYAKARLFRQPLIGDWQGAVAHVKSELQRFVASR